MKKTLLAAAAALTLASAVPASAQAIDSDPFAADQSLAILAALGTAGTVATVVVAVIVTTVVLEVIDEDEPTSSSASTN